MSYFEEILSFRCHPEWLRYMDGIVEKHPDLYKCRADVVRAGVMCLHKKLEVGRNAVLREEETGGQHGGVNN